MINVGKNMLLKKQQIHLILLTQHPKFGQLLADAIESWKYAKPQQGEHGLDIYTYKFRSENNPSCCLLGAAFFGKGPFIDDGFDEGLNKIYNLNHECSWFIDGFDDRGYKFSYYYYENNFEYDEAYNFAQKIRKIIFGH